METRVVAISRFVETCLRSFKVKRWRAGFCLIHVPHLIVTLADGMFHESYQQNLSVYELNLALVHCRTLGIPVAAGEWFA